MKVVEKYLASTSLNGSNIQDAAVNSVQDEVFEYFEHNANNSVPYVSQNSYIALPNSLTKAINGVFLSIGNFPALS